MSKKVSPQFWKVIWNGQTLFGGLASKAEAYARAEKWQGTRSRGLLKHGDKKDYIEVVEDRKEMRNFDDRWDEAKRGNGGRVIFEHSSDEPLV